MDKDLVGRTTDAFDVFLERGKVREFARATRSSLPEQLSGEGVIPTTFLTTSTAWAPEGGVWGDALDWTHILNGEQEFVFFGTPPAVGAHLRAVARVESIYEKEGRRGVMTFGEAVTTFTDTESGEVVAELRTVLIETPPSTRAAEA